MQKFKYVIGLPVVCIDKGKKVGRVDDIIFAKGNKGVQSLVLEKKGAEFCRKIIPIEDIVSLGNDAVIINDLTCIRKVTRKDLTSNNVLHGMHIFTKDGRDLGVVKDILFDYKNATIEAFEISDGVFSDIFTGRKILPLFGKVEFGDDSILISDEALDEMTSTGGGIKNRLN